MKIKNNNNNKNKQTSVPIYGNKDDQTAGLSPMDLYAHGFYGHHLNPISTTIDHSQLSV